ncbi:MAG: hypothetical protein ACTS27_02545 [Phycisphaerales bacterium]
MTNTTKGLCATTAMLHAGAIDENHPSVQHAHRVYRRLVSTWASDLMRLRAQGLHVPSHRDPAAERAGAAVADRIARKAA